MRCIGHCCKRFAIEHNFEALQADYQQWLCDPSLSRIADVEKIATMVIPITSSRDGTEHRYTCKNLQANGDCSIYETRPQMCRDFPGPEGCHFRACKSSQSAYFEKSWLQRLVIRYRWLKSL